MSTIHTQQTLAELSFRDLQQAAKDLGLNAQGNRDEITAKILDAQRNSAPLDAAPEVPEDEDEPQPEVTTTDNAPSEIVDGNTPEASSVEPPAGTVPLPTPAGAALTPSAKKLLARLAASYLTSAGYAGAVEDSVVTAIESGKQPCIVKGSGNTKFEVKVFDQAFCRDVVARDVPAGRGGVVMNLARRLADANQYPRSR